MPERDELKQVDALTLQKWLEKEKAVLIDIREQDEYVREHIPGARLVPLSGFNPEDFPHDHEKVGVFHCRSGARTENAAAKLLATGFHEVYHLKGGLKGWQDAGLPLNFNRKAPISIMRQVQIAAGALILLGVGLAAVVSPWFLLLSGLVGAGLLQAGVIGTCGMATLLGAMPWNRKDAVPQAGTPCGAHSAS